MKINKNILELLRKIRDSLKDSSDTDARKLFPNPSVIYTRD